VASSIYAREAVVSTCLDQDAEFICPYTSSCFRDLFVCLFVWGREGGRGVGEWILLSPTFLLMWIMHHDMFHKKVYVHRSLKTKLIRYVSYKNRLWIRIRFESERWLLETGSE
jgi:hypothetical protein